MIERHAELYGEAPAQVACDGGYASKANPREAKALGVVDIHKKRGLDPLEMASSAGVHGRLRAGIEAAIRTGSAELPGICMVGHRHAQPGRSCPQQAETAGVDGRPARRASVPIRPEVLERRRAGIYHRSALTLPLTLPLTLFVAAPGFAEREWLPAERAVAVDLARLSGGGGVIFPQGSGDIPGLAGRLTITV